MPWEGRAGQVRRPGGNGEPGSIRDTKKTRGSKEPGWRWEAEGSSGRRAELPEFQCTSAGASGSGGCR